MSIKPEHAEIVDTTLANVMVLLFDQNMYLLY